MDLSEIDQLFLSQATFHLRSKEKDTILRIFLNIYDQADCFTKNFGGRSRKLITKNLRNRPIMFGFGHSLQRVCKTIFHENTVLWGDNHLSLELFSHESHNLPIKYVYVNLPPQSQHRAPNLERISTLRHKCQPNKFESLLWNRPCLTSFNSITFSVCLNDH